MVFLLRRNYRCNSKIQHKKVLSGLPGAWHDPAVLTGQISRSATCCCPCTFRFLCGFVCGPFWEWLWICHTASRSVLFGMPPLSHRLDHGLRIVGLWFVERMAWQDPSERGKGLITALIVAMIGGRIVWSGCLCFYGGMLSIGLCSCRGLLNAWPGIVLQLIPIPPLVSAIRRFLSQ